MKQIHESTMTEKKIVKLNSGVFLLVEVPEWVTRFYIDKEEGEPFAIALLGAPGQYETHELPPGQWEIIGKGNEITEEAWKEIVDVFVFVDEESGHYADEYYRNYENVQQIVSRDFDLETSTESGISWIKSHGMKPETTLILKLK